MPTNCDNVTTLAALPIASSSDFSLRRSGPDRDHSLMPPDCVHPLYRPTITMPPWIHVHQNNTPTNPAYQPSAVFWGTGCSMTEGGVLGGGGPDRYC